MHVHMSKIKKVKKTFKKLENRFMKRKLYQEIYKILAKETEDLRKRLRLIHCMFECIIFGNIILYK